MPKEKHLSKDIVWIWLDSLDQPEGMSVTTDVAAEDSVVVHQVNAHLSVGMDDVSFIDEHSHVGDLLFLVVEKQQVAGQGFVDQVNSIALSSLDGGIAGDSHSAHLKDQLHESRAVDSKG